MCQESSRLVTTFGEKLRGTTGRKSRRTCLRVGCCQTSCSQEESDNLLESLDQENGEERVQKTLIL